MQSITNIPATLLNMFCVVCHWRKYSKVKKYPHMTSIYILVGKDIFDNSNLVYSRCWEFFGRNFSVDIGIN